MHITEGLLGHAFVVISFVSSGLAAWGYYRGARKDASWVDYATKVFYVHCAAVVGIVGVLFYLISSHYFEYHYVYSHSSRYLPVYYQISCFWEGQEGSFLLWMFWNVVLGIVLIRTNKVWKAPVMLVMCLTQLFLSSMVLGVVVFDLKIGSSPFLLLRDAIDAPIFNTNPNFIPEDGSGLNPLLQNYWMVIHPPTLFLGYAATVIPFAYCIGGLIVGKPREWVTPALPWAQFAALTLGVGIAMGAYWAYETLNFGGYWNWDPVENAVYVPWLVLIAAIHVMLAYKKEGAALKASIVLVVATFMLILYSTFLTRSGILGDASVHAFTDLGLSAQLLVYLFVFLLLSVWLMAVRWSSIPSSQREMESYSGAFWIFTGATLLGLMAFQVLVYTSIPVYNAVAESMGFQLNMAPPTDLFYAYSFPQLLLSSVVAVLTGTGQFFWWKKAEKNAFFDHIKLPLLATLVSAALVIGFAQISTWYYILLLLTALYSFFANVGMLITLAKARVRLSGGAIAHIGVAFILVGVLFSSGYSRILSKNYTGMVWSSDFPDEVNSDNLLMFVNEPRQMGHYSMIYRGMKKWTKERGYVEAHELRPTKDPLRAVYEEDTLSLVNEENSYFMVEYYTDGDKQFTLYPRVQMNESMGGLVLSPAIRRSFSEDIYTHVKTFPDPKEETNWSEPKEVKVKIGERFFINDYVATLEQMEPVTHVRGERLSSSDVAVKARVKVEGEYQEYVAEPTFIIRNESMVGRMNDWVKDLAFKISIQRILPEEEALIFSYQTTQKDWIILEAVKKPWINLFWIGTLLMSLGFVVAILRHRPRAL